MTRRELFAAFGIGAATVRSQSIKDTQIRTITKRQVSAGIIVTINAMNSKSCNDWANALVSSLKRHGLIE